MDNGSAKLTGTIVHKGEIDTSYATWTKQEFVITYNDGYRDQLRKFTIGCKPDADPHRVNNFDKFNKVGMKVDVEFNLKGRSWDSPDKGTLYFNDDEAWKVFKAEDGEAEEGIVPPPMAPSFPEVDDEDIPF